MSEYLSTDPNFGLDASGYLSTDPDFGLQEAAPESQDNPLKRGWNKMAQSVGIAGALATRDAEGAARRVAEAARYQAENPGSKEGNELMAAWQRGDGISGGVNEVAGEFKKDWKESPGVVSALRGAGKNAAAMGAGVVEQVPNMILPMAGMLAGGAAGAATPVPGGTIGGAWLGASAGNAIVEGGGMAQQALQKAGINPLDTESVKAYLGKNGDTILAQAGIKGAVIGAVDTATMGIGGKLLMGPAKAATGRALLDMGVDVTDKAAVQAAIKSPELASRVAADPIYKAATTGAQGTARNVTTAALEPAGEFTGEYLGQGLATGEYDEKDAFLEAASSIGQSGMTFAGQKAYAAMKYPFKADKGQGGQPPADAPTADDVLGAPVVKESFTPEPTEAEKALYSPKAITALDRVAEIDAKLPAASPEESPALMAERDQIAASWPKATPGVETTFTTEAGARLNGQYALMEAGDLTTSHDENLRPVVTYPAELQPRERERHASEVQIQQIVGRLDPARLGESADVSTGAPIVGADGLVESGNARTIALKRAYAVNDGRWSHSEVPEPDAGNGSAAGRYRKYLKANADRFGITPESVDAMQKPVLVRVRSTPVNRAEFARQANQSTVARMSPSEQARSDASQIDGLEDLNPTESGDFSSGTSSGFIRRFMAKLPATEQAGLIDSTGQLSQAGYQRIRNAVLAKAYGDSPVLQRMVESMDSNVRNVGAALLKVAPQVAKAREAINENALFDADITPDLMAAVEELSALKDKGTSVTEALAQAGMFGDKLTPEARDLLAFLDQNIRSPKRIAEFIQSYLDALTAAGNPAQGSMFGDTAAPAKVDLIAAARRIANGQSAAAGSATAGNTATAQEGGKQPENAQGNQAGAQGNEASEWLTFPPDTGTLGIPRAEMPQVKGEHRGALIQFLQGRGISHETIEAMPASQLKPTQAEFSTKKVEGWKEARDGVDRSVLASSDGYILDGHHQWVAALASGETEKVIRFDVPIQELLAAVREFPSVKKSEGAPKRAKDEVRREIIEQKWQEALSDLGAIVRDYVPMTRMLPENTPNLMPTLVKLFEARFGKVGMQINDLMKYVKAELKAIPEFRTVWNKILPETYRKAAAQALANHQAAPNGDLFAQNVGAGEVADRIEKALGGMLAPDGVDVEQAARDLDAQIAEAERLLPEFKEIVEDLGEKAGAKVLVVPIKTFERAFSKVVFDYDGDASHVKDLLRATLVADDWQHVNDAVATVVNALDLDAGNKALSRNWWEYGIETPSGYRDAKFVFPVGGMLVELQINTQPMIDAKEKAHPLYEKQEKIKRAAVGRAMTDDEKSEFSRLDREMNAFYAAAFSASVPKASQSDGASIAPPSEYAVRGENGRGAALSKASASERSSENIDAPGDTATGIPPTSKKTVPLGNDAADGTFMSNTSTANIARQTRFELAMDERSVYAVREPDGISGDLFPETLNATLPENQGKAGRRKASTQAGNGNLRSATALSVRQAPDTPGLYLTHTQLVTVGSRGLPVSQVHSVDDAAKVFAYLARFAVEHYDALVTDSDGNPLAFIGSFKGAITQTAMYPQTVIGELSRIGGAANLWAAHNHPGGTPELSFADIKLSNNFAEILRGSGITYHPFMAIAKASDGSVLYKSTAGDSGQVDTHRPAENQVPIVERQFSEGSTNGERIGSPREAQTLVPALAKERPGIVFLNSQNWISAFVPFDAEHMGRLRDGSRLMRLFGAVSSAGASSAIVAMPDEKVSLDQVNNLAAALASIDIQVVDGIAYRSDGAGETKALAESGWKPPFAAPFLSRLNQSRPDTGRRIHIEDLNAVIKAFRAAFPGLPIHALEVERQAPKELLKWIRERNAQGNWSAAVHQGEVYLLREGLMNAQDAMEKAIHEAEHAGLERMFGQQLDTAMLGIYRSNAEVRAAADALATKYRYSAVRATNEVLADMGAKAKDLSGWRRLVAAVRDILRGIRVAGRQFVSDWTDNDVEALVLRALAAAKREPGNHVAQGTWTALARIAGFNNGGAAVVSDFKNNNPLKAHADYKAAKAGDIDAAARLVQALVKPESIETAKKAFGDDAIYVPVHAEEASGRNQIPNMLAHWYSDQAGGDVSLGIAQTNRAYHTGANAMERLLARAEFSGKVEPGRRYVLIDDVTTMGSTLADLASYIRIQGGEVVGSVVLVNAMRGGMMTPASKTINELEARHGDEIRKLFGIEPGALTANEAQYLLGFRTTDELRNRVAKAESERSQRLRAKGVLPERQDSSGGVTRLSRVGQADVAPTIEQRADAIIQQKSATSSPLDAMMKGAVRLIGLPKLTTALYNKAAFLIDRYTPETIKAGVVSDYGVPESVIDARALMEGRQRQQLRGAGALLEKLATLTRAESRVAYEWMNNDDPQAADYFEQQLSPESVKVLKEVRDLVDQLSKEAIRLGQLSQDVYDRNKFAYLRRSYVKHTAELTNGESAGRSRAIAILGDQYKGRGMTDAVDMAKFKAIAPEWWNRKLQAGKADKQLRGEKFIRLERRAPIGAGTAPLAGMSGPTPKKQRLLEVAYWPAGEPIPARLSTWDQSGTWEVRDTKGGKLVVWRDFTKEERVAMGEIDEARYAIAKTLHGMIHDVETGKYLEWLGQKYAKKDGEAIDGTIVEASERMRDTFKPGEWVQVPDTVITGTRVKKYGTLAGRYLPGPIWNDVRQIMGGRFKPLGDTYAALHRAWKTSKTALSPAVHMNNVMANFVMADWHDVTAGHVLKSLKLMLSKDAGAQEILARFGDSGGTIGTWATKELQQEQLRPLLEQLEKELGVAGNASGQVGVMSALQLMMSRKFPEAFDALKGSKSGKGAVWAGRKMIDLYEAEDQVFRLAAWLKAKEEGATDLAAGKVARKSFLDYSINAPWVQMMRSTAFPFIAFTYRSVPMLLETAAKKPWKLLKLGIVAGALNALGYMLSGGDEDDERKLLPEEKAGSIWGLTPKLVRMPWNADLMRDGVKVGDAPVFLDVRRWIPVGDIFDAGATNTAIPVLPSMVPGGPLALLFELVLNKQGFTGKAITLETDTGIEKAEKVADYLYKAFSPNIIALPGTHAFTGAMNAGSGKTDAFGRELSLTQAVASSFGVKLGSYPGDVLKMNAQREAQAKLMEIDRNITGLKRQRMVNGIDDEEFREKATAQIDKKRKLADEFRGRM